MVRLQILCCSNNWSNISKGIVSSWNCEKISWLMHRCLLPSLSHSIVLRIFSALILNSTNELGHGGRHDSIPC